MDLNSQILPWIFYSETHITKILVDGAFWSKWQYNSSLRNNELPVSICQFLK